MQRVRYKHTSYNRNDNEHANTWMNSKIYKCEVVEKYALDGAQGWP